MATVASATLNCKTPSIYQQCQQQIDFKANGQTDRRTDTHTSSKLPLAASLPPSFTPKCHPTQCVATRPSLFAYFHRLFGISFFLSLTHIFSLFFVIVVCNCWVAKAATEFVVLFAVIYLFYIRFLSPATCWRLTRFAFPWWMKLNYVGHKFQRLSRVNGRCSQVSRGQVSRSSESIFSCLFIAMYHDTRMHVMLYKDTCVWHFVGLSCYS